MSTALIPDEGMKIFQDKINGVGVVAGFMLRLFQNNFTPSKSSTVASFTEATFSGYSAQSVTWGAGSVSANISTALATALTFTRGIGATSNTIYGWYLTDTGNAKVWACNLLSSPKSMAVNGDGIIITLTELVGDF